MVNGITIQAKTIAHRKLPSVTKTKKRSINPPQQMLHPYIVGQQEGPPKSNYADVDDVAATQSARKNNLVWSWTDYNVQTHDTSVTSDNVDYLPTINVPATQMSTIKEVLNQWISIRQSLQLRKIVCVFDQALYSKVAEVI